jgi:hypothetical protein
LAAHELKHVPLSLLLACLSRFAQPFCNSILVEGRFGCHERVALFGIHAEPFFANSLPERRGVRNACIRDSTGRSHSNFACTTNATADDTANQRAAPDAFHDLLVGVINLLGEQVLPCLHSGFLRSFFHAGQRDATKRTGLNGTQFSLDGLHGSAWCDTPSGCSLGHTEDGLDGVTSRRRGDALKHPVNYTYFGQAKARTAETCQELLSGRDLAAFFAELLDVTPHLGGT